MCREQYLFSAADTVHRKGTSTVFLPSLLTCLSVALLWKAVVWVGSPWGEAWTSRGGVLSVLVKETGEGRWLSLGPTGLPQIMFCRKTWYGTVLPLCAQKMVVLSEGTASGCFGAGWLLFGL